MSKYNHIKSIPMDSIPEEELKQAIKEFAEGDESMEKLLWASYKKGLETNGCHAGAHPYIGYNYEPNEKYINLISKTLSQKGSQILLSPDGGNPFSGRDWYKPDFTIGFTTEYKDEANQKFDMITDAIENDNDNNKEYEMVIKLFNILIGKYSDLDIRIKHTEEGEYIFSIERAVDEERFEILAEFNNLFLPAKLELKENETPKKSWEIRDTNKEQFINKINESITYILDNYSIKTPESKEETDSWQIEAHLKRNECIENGNEREFELWLMEEREKFDQRIAEAKKENKENKVIQTIKNVKNCRLFEKNSKR